MKNGFKILLCLALFVFANVTYAQKLPGLDKSPHDIAYYRGQDKEPLVKVVYGRPQKNGREIFGKLEAFGEVWRTGANESTEIKFYKDAKVNGKDIKAGTYTLFTIPDKDKWTIILNSQLDQWGAYTYNQEKDVLRVDVPAGTSPSVVEAFSIAFKDDDDKVKMILAWDKTLVEVPLAF